MNKFTPKIIAFYLPQFHPTPNNDKWWGKGFTEWTNVGKAKPLFKGHYQPKVPADLGYYDLRLPQVREAQAQLAKEAGIYGFCYYHYWFGNGKQELELPFNEVLKSGTPDFPFCLCWANESWNKKFWNADGTYEKELLAEQKYEDNQTNEDHFNYLINAFKDKRYIKIDNKPLFMIYKPLDFKNVSNLINQWNNLAKQNGFSGMYFIGHTYEPDQINPIKELGFNAINVTRTWEPYRNIYNKKTIRGLYSILKKRLLDRPYIIDYNIAKKFLIGKEYTINEVYPSIVPNWDHTPRSKKGGFVFTNSTPKKFEEHIKDVLLQIKNKPNKDQIVFLKSWNEWGEGNYMEPDLKWGKEYIYSLKRVLEENL